METLREDTRKHAHQTNGAAESANHQGARHANLIMMELEQSIGETLDRGTDFLLWLREYTAIVKKRFHQKDGQTPHFRFHGNEFNEDLCKFCDATMCSVHPVPKKIDELIPYYENAIYLGVHLWGAFTLRMTRS